VTCAICEDTGWKTITIDGVSRVARCECWHQQLSQSLLKNARIPRRYAHCELSNFEIHTDTQRAAHRKAARLVEQFPVVDRGLLFYGNAGVGKTHLAVALMKDAIVRKSARAVFYEVRELLKLVRDTYNSSTEMSELDVLRPVLEADLLVLDDLGAEKKSEWVDETMGLVMGDLVPASRALDPRYARAASSLGATPARVLVAVKLPILLRLTFADGSVENVKLPVEAWNLGDTFVYRVKNGKKVVRAQVDPDMLLPDTDRTNNGRELR